MNPHRLAAPLVLAMCAGALAPVQAQAPGSVSACAAVEIDADRLACYDAAAGRQARTPEQADADADRARQVRAAASDAEITALDQGERARRMASDLYRQDSDSLGDALANAGKGSLLDSRWELARDSKLGTFNFRAYKPVYLLPLYWSDRQNLMPHSPNPDNSVATLQQLDHVEAKFQLSFKTKALENLFGDNGDLWMGYTQSSRWQVYSAGQSRPFRETNYEPEVLLVFRNNYRLPGWKGRMAAVGINHQSNGRADPLSRSWNRVMFNVGLDREGWSLMLRPWWRIPERRGDDDNPDIEDYMGRGDATLVHGIGRHELALTARHSLRSGARAHGALQFDWGFPINRRLRGHLQLFDGYGESMIDYNHRAIYVGFGISLLEWY